MRSFLISIVTLFLLGIIVFFGITFYFIKQHPQYITDKILSTISKQLKDTSISAHSIGFHLIPFPKLYLTNVILQTQKGDIIHIKECLITPNITNILSGNISIYSIEVIQPIASIILQNEAQKDSKTAEYAIPKQISHLLQSIADSKLFIENGSITFQNNDYRVKIIGINGKIGVSKTLTSSLKLTVDEVIWEIINTVGNNSITAQKSIKKVQLHIEDMPYEINTALLHNSSPLYDLFTNTKKTTCKVSGAIPITNTTNNITFDFTTKLEKDNSNKLTMHGQLHIEGTLPNGDTFIPILLSVPFATTSSEDTTHFPPLLIKNSKLLFDKTHIDLHGTIKNYDTLSNIFFDGTMDVRNFSFPYWFAFARQLPNGIQHALNQLSGEIKFTLSPQQVNAQKIIIHSLDTTFQGNGSVNNFSSPTITLSLATKQFNLNALLPELKGKKSSQLSYPKETFLTILSNLHNNNNNNNKIKKTINYDITIQADHVTCWKFDGYQFVCNIQPKPQGTQIHTNCKNFYDGTLSSSFLLSNKHTIQLAIENIQLSDITNIITKEYELKGKASGTSHVNGHGDTLASFLSNLKGTIDLYVTDGLVKKTASEAIPFSMLHLTCDSIGQPSKRNKSSTTPYKGKWGVEISSATWNGSITMDGLIQFSTTDWLPIRAENIPSKVVCSVSGIQTVAYGGISFDIDNNFLSFSNFQGEMHPKTAISGTIKTSSNTSNTRQWEGSLTIVTQNLRNLLSKLGYEPKNISPTMLQYCKLQGDIFISPATIRLTNIQGVLDSTLIKFSLNGLQTNPPSWTGDIQLSSLNLDEYLLSINQNKLKKSQELWPIELLNKVNIQSTLTIAELIYRKVPYTNVVLPISLSQGTLSITPITASLCDGKTEASFKASPLSTNSNNAQIDFHYISKGVDMIKLSKKRQQDYLISGLGTVAINIQSIAKSSIDFLKNLQGKWRISIQNGYFKRNTATTQQNFSNIGATGNIINGIITNNNFAIIGPGMAITGSGKIDLPEWNLDYLINIDMEGFPIAIPIKYTGSIDNPKRTINAAKLILSTIGSLGRDTIGLIQDIFSAPLKLLLP